MADLTVGTFTPSVILALADRIGALRGRGISVREQAVPSSPAQFRSLLDGAIDAALTSPDNAVAYRFLADNPLRRTADVRIVLGVDRGLGLALFGRRGVVGATDLRGGTIGVDVATSGFAYALYELMKSLGLHRHHDYRVVELGSTPRRLAALLAGECDATMLNAGNDLLAEDGGCPRLVRLVDVAEPYLGTVLCVMGASSDKIRALAGALCDGVEAIMSRSVDDLATREAARLLNLSQPQARRYVARLTDPREGLIPDGRVDLPAMATVVDLRIRHGGYAVAAAESLRGALKSERGLVDDLAAPPGRARPDQDAAGRRG